MIIRFLAGSAFLMLVAAACNTTKKTIPVAAAPAEPAIALDTISVIANEPVKQEPYRAANTIANDLLYTELDVRFNWEECKLYGRASLQLKPHFYPTDVLYLNARGMDIKHVEVHEEASVTEKKKVGNKIVEEKVDIWNAVLASSFKYKNDSLKINLGRMFSNKENYYVVIDYIARPNELKSGGSNAITDDKGLYFVNPKGENTYKMPQIWTQGETQSSSAWFPTIDSPNQKMLQEIFITVEEKYTTLSNGVLVDSQKDGHGLRTDHWKLDQPHAPYLAMMAVGEFKKVVDQPWNGKEISYYVEKEYEPYAKAIFGDTREMIDFYSNKLGVPYAWPKYAQIAVRDYVSGAMENTSATLHGDFMVYQTAREMVDGKKGNSVIAHELFHQWFGDLVTSESWSNLPLNESFATYGEYLWEEYKFGRDAADYHSYLSRQGYLSAEKEVNLIRYHYEDREDMFDNFSYNKGGQVLHMLRKAVGDEAFFASLKKYLETNKYRPVEIHQLRLAFEETTGRDMNWFFDQWFLNKGRPKLKVSKKFNPTGSVLELTVEQTQDLKQYPLYTLPLEVDMYTEGSPDRRHLDITEAKQTFTIITDGAPKLVNFDAERQLLCDLEYEKSIPEYVFQYRNAPLFGDRWEALRKLNPSVDSSAYNVFKHAARNDKFHAIRNLAMGKLENMPSDKPAVKQLLLDIYNTDKNTLTRSEALGALNRQFGSEADIKALNEKALGEQSYAICRQALEGIIKQSPEQAMAKAKLFENENSTPMLMDVAEIYAKEGSDAQIPFFHNSIKNIIGFEMIGFCSFYSQTAARCNDLSNMIMAAKDLEMVGNGANKFIKYGALKGLKDLLSALDRKEKTQAVTETREAISKLYEGLK
jgi:aminopeptidase N